MHTIRTFKDIFETYELIDEKENSSIQVVPERGAIISKFKCGEKHVLYLDKSTLDDTSKSIRGGIPILFPMAGKLEKDEYNLNGKIYPMKQHGFARNFQWAVLGTNINDCAEIKLQLLNNNQTKSIYPFDFELKFTYKLKGNKLRLEQEITNHSNEEMPFSLGFHPYFFVEDKSQIEIDIRATQYFDNKTKEVKKYSGFDFSLDEIDMHFLDHNVNYTTIKNLKDKNEVNLSYSEDFKYLVFWTLKGKDFICVEPWTGPGNSLNTRKDIQLLPSKKTKNFYFEISVR